VQLLADSEVNAATLTLLDVLKQAPFERQHAILDYLNIVVSLWRRRSSRWPRGQT